MSSAYHIPALLQATLNNLNIQPSGRYIDATFGGGGHSNALLKLLNQDGHLYAFDQDADAQLNVIPDNRLTFIHANFRYVKNFMTYHKQIGSIDGIIADLGVSFHHFDTEQRGFSFRFDAPLDMRMNQSASLTAEYIVNNYTENQLTDIFRLYGELPNAKLIAQRIVTERQHNPIQRINQLNDIVAPLCGKDKEKKKLACIYQALRIETNDELGALRQLLNSSYDILKDGGRFAILTYHSLEDRIVKNFFRSGNLDGNIQKDFYGNTISPWTLVNNKVITASEQEILNNPRSRSAKLRIAQKKSNQPINLL